MQSEGQYIRIEGDIRSVVYQNPENGYAVMRVDVGGDTVTAVGCLPDASAGEHIAADGVWTAHQSYGQQFKADRIERSMPTGKSAIYQYLALGAVKGIGPATAALIVDKFGDETLEIIETEPERLSEIKGISLKKAIAIGSEFRRRGGMRLIMEFLVEYGVRPELAVKLYRCYGDAALDAVRDNPYILSLESFGADFFEADTLALNLGFDSESPRRTEAAVLFEMRYNLNNGHVFLPRGKLVDATARLIDASHDSVDSALDRLEEHGYVIRDGVAGQDAFYLCDMHEAETYVAARLGEMARGGSPVKKDLDRLIKNIEREQGVTYAALQREAVLLAAESEVMVLTGGPGTGKTTAIRGILAMFDSLGLITALCAPTGRAAKRISELNGREASTIHRLLEAGYSMETDSIQFSRDEDNPLEADAVILDEASMVDITLMASLLRAMRRGCRLVLVGDADQLPSVGPGNVFSDIIRSNAVGTIRLTEIFRQAEASAIIRNAHLINGGQSPEWTENKGDFFFMQRSTRERAADTIVELCAERLPKNMGIDPSQIQVLSPTRQSETGTENLNRRIQAAVNPPRPDKNEKQYGEYIYREGDRVMQIRNNYDIIWKNTDGLTGGSGVFNGDTGRILHIDRQTETMEIDFDGRLTVYPFELLHDLEPAFAMTVHKAQGSEYRAVILCAMPGASALMTRGVLYTAVTRAKELLIIVGDTETASRMTADDRRQRRYSGLRARLDPNG